MASDLGLHCLPMSHKKDARLIWVNGNRTHLRGINSYGNGVFIHVYTGTNFTGVTVLEHNPA